MVTESCEFAIENVKTDTTWFYGLTLVNTTKCAENTLVGAKNLFSLSML